MLHEKAELNIDGRITQLSYHVITYQITTYIHMFIISDKMLSFSERGGYANLIFLLKKMLKYLAEE